MLDVWLDYIIFLYTCSICVLWLTNQTYTAITRRTSSTILRVQSSPASVRTLIDRIFKSLTVQAGQPHSFSSAISCRAFFIPEDVLYWGSVTKLPAYNFRCLIKQTSPCTNRPPRTIILNLHVTCVGRFHTDQANFHFC